MNENTDRMIRRVAMLAVIVLVGVICVTTARMMGVFGKPATPLTYKVGDVAANEGQQHHRPHDRSHFRAQHLLGV